MAKANIMYWLGDNYFCDYIERARKINDGRTDEFLRSYWIWNQDFALIGLLGRFIDTFERDSSKAIQILNEAIEIVDDKPKVERLKKLKSEIISAEFDKAVEKAEEILDEIEFIPNPLATLFDYISDKESLNFFGIPRDSDDFVRHITNDLKKTRIGYAELMRITKRSNLKNLLNKLPAEWVSGIAKISILGRGGKERRLRKLLSF